MLWNYSQLKSYPIAQVESDIRDSSSRLADVIELPRAGISSISSAVLLGWRQSLIMLSNRDLYDVGQLAKTWLATDSDSWLPFRAEVIEEHLSRDPNLGVLRYFPPDNGQYEAVAIISHQEFLRNEHIECIESMSRHFTQRTIELKKESVRYMNKSVTDAP